MGAHTLGGCQKQNSGYHGRWTMGEENYFNQKYYQFILGYGDSPSLLYIVNKVKKHF